MAILLSAVVGVYAFGATLSLQFAAGALAVAISVFNFLEPDPPASSAAATPHADRPLSRH